MNILNKIITEEISKTVLDNQIKKIQVLMSDLKQIDFSSYGNEIVNFAQRVGQLSYYVIGTNENAKRYAIASKNGRRGRGFYFNPNFLSNTLRKGGFKIPNEGLTDNVYSNSVKAYNWSQDKMSKLNGNDNNQVNNKDAVANAQAVQIKKIMASTWPQLFSEYANLVARYRYVLQKLPTVTSLVKTLDELYGSLK